MTTPRMAAATTVPRIQRKVASVGSWRTEGCSMRPSGWRISSAMAGPLCLDCALQVELEKVGGAFLIGVVARKDWVPFQVPDEIRQPQPAHSKGGDEVHPVFRQGIGREQGQNLVVKIDEVHE